MSVGAAASAAATPVAATPVGAASRDDGRTAGSAVSAGAAAAGGASAGAASAIDSQPGGVIAADRAGPTYLGFLIGGQLLSSVGSHISGVAIPLLAVTVLGATPFQMGLLSAVQAVPNLLLAIVAGVLADRMRKRPVMLLADAARALLMVLVAVLVATGQMRMAALYAIVLCISACGVFFDVSLVAIVPAVVPREQLLRVNRLIQAGRATSSLLGKGVSGLLIAAVSIAGALYLDALTYAISFVCIWAIRADEPRPAAGTPHAPAWVEARDGFRFIWSEPRLRAMTAYAATSNASISALFAIYLLYLSTNLAMSPVYVGVIMGTLGVGSLLGTVLVSSDPARVGLVLTAAALVAGAATGALAMSPGASELYIVARQMGALIALGASLTIVNVYIAGITQAITPARLMARVVGVTQFTCSLMIPLGALAGGSIADAAGARVCILLVAAAFVLSAAWLVCSPVFSLTSVTAMREAGPGLE